MSLQLAGDEVGALWTVKLRLRIGSAKVRTGGIKNVNTAEKHRLKGYASRGMQAAFELMNNSGYDISILFGIPDFYHRFGYAAVFPESWLYVKTTDLLRAEARGATQNMKRKTDLPEMLRWYNRNNSERTGSVIRTKSWRYRRPRSLGVIGALDARKRLVGYLRYLKEVRNEDDRLDVVELETRDSRVFDSLAAGVGRQARRRNASEVRFWLPPDHPFGAYCASLGCRWETHHSPNGNAMARIIRLEGFMRKLLPEFGRRLDAAESSWKGSLTLSTDIGAIGLEVNGRRVQLRSPEQRVSAIKIPQTALTQLVMGYRSAEEVAQDPQVRIPVRMVPVMAMLFPRGNPYMAYPDRF